MEGMEWLWYSQNICRTVVVCTFNVFDDHCKFLQEGNPVEMMSLVHLGVDLKELERLMI